MSAAYCASDGGTESVFTALNPTGSRMRATEFGSITAVAGNASAGDDADNCACPRGDAIKSLRRI